MKFFRFNRSVNMPNSYEIFTVANDKMARNLASLLFSIKENSEIDIANVRVIPFDGNVKIVQEICAAFNVQLVKPLAKWDSLGKALFKDEDYRPSVPAWRYFRKLNALSLAKGSYAFIDANAIVLSSLIPVFNALDDCDVIFGGYSADGRNFKKSFEKILNIANPNIKQGFNAGFWLSKFDPELNKYFLKLNDIDLRPYLTKSPEQSVLSMVMALRGKKLSWLKLVCNDLSYVGAGKEIKSQNGFITLNHPKNTKVVVMKWNGNNMNLKDSMPNRDLYLNYLNGAVAQLVQNNPEFFNQITQSWLNGEGNSMTLKINEIDENLPLHNAAHPRDIAEEDLKNLRSLTPYQECLDGLVERARSTIGFFTKHPTRSIEYPWVVSLLERFDVKKVLDIGSGVSVLPIRFADAGMTVITVDYSDTIRTKKTMGSWTEWGFLDYSMFDKRIRSFNTDLANVKTEGSFDACYSVSVIEHMPKALQQSMLKSAAKLVKKGGLLVLTLDLVPKSYSMWNRDRGKVVEDPTIHGDLYTFFGDAHKEGWMLEQLEIVRGIPGSVTDVALCVFHLEIPAKKQDIKPFKELSASSLKTSFTEIFKKGKWPGGGAETVSGAGSTLSYTSIFRPALEKYLTDQKIQSILDAPCGDFNWFKEMNLPEVNYIGMDIVDDLIQSNQEKYGSGRRKFQVGDITSDPLPKVEIMHCRDCLMHLPTEKCFDFFNNFLSSGIEKLLLTSHLNSENSDLLKAGGFRQINFRLPPFNFPEPIVAITDFQPGFPKREMCLWTSDQIRSALKKKDDLRKIIVFGFPHSGTSILKSIIGHIDDVHEFPYERQVITPEMEKHDKKYTLIKYPWTREVFFTDEYKDYIKIFIIRNPYYVYSSSNKRFNYNLIKQLDFINWEKTAERFINMQDKKLNNIYCIKYEDIFQDNFKKLKAILNDIGFVFDDTIFDNSKFKNVITKDDIEKIIEKPANSDHDAYRTWQINQKFENMNTGILDLTEEQLQLLEKSKFTEKLGYFYPKA